eukprot:gnl/MRDRNA2_/MRDRNA2_56003_c0_seq1.p1 gnl/MRDRNA2_/MRDRNA2_56003_c0~~gnl/MRDRNA2_/MRDRNA2_56003_c0_seq1.p1  ORF type:complete len:335 (+),score=28.37 gnl/MRDRNA2_/MRDRNA2_56003_c0_seq1:98-1102(+)
MYAGQSFTAPQQERVLHSVYRDASLDAHDEDSDEEADCSSGTATIAGGLWSKTTGMCRGTFGRFLRAAAAGTCLMVSIFLGASFLPILWVGSDDHIRAQPKNVREFCPSSHPQDQHTITDRSADSSQTLRGRFQDMMSFGGHVPPSPEENEVFTAVCGEPVAELFRNRGEDFYQGVIDCVGLLGLCTTNCLGHCLQGKFPMMSGACGQCFEVGAVCGKQHCWEECALHGKTSIECRNCAKGKCGGSLQTELGFREAYVYSLRSSGCDSEFYNIFQKSRDEDTGYKIPRDMQTCTGLVFDVLMNIGPPSMHYEKGTGSTTSDKPSILSRIRDDVR